jgi:hypothetical protein
MLTEIARFRPFSPPQSSWPGVSRRSRAPDIKPLGIGITLLPRAMREFSALGSGDAFTAAGIENRESRFYNGFGQLIDNQPRGKFAGFQYPKVGFHRDGLHLILYETVLARLRTRGGAHRP